MAKKTKPQPIAVQTKQVEGSFTVTKALEEKSGALVIEGFANRATVDRMQEVIPPEAWRLDNYRRNPVILWQHGKDANLDKLPIGKAIDVKATKDGLKIRVELSQSDDPRIKVIRDLVEEGNLRTFSVGFNPVKEARNKDGVLVVEEAELYEVSIVTMPMNVDSEFAISSKDFEYDGCRAREVLLRQKGCWAAASVQARLFQLLTSQGIIGKDVIMDALCQASGLDKGALTEVLAGNVTPLPETVVDACVKVLGMSPYDLDWCNEMDVDAEVPKDYRAPSATNGSAPDATKDSAAAGDDETDGQKGSDAPDTKEAGAEGAGAVPEQPAQETPAAEPASAAAQAVALRVKELVGQGVAPDEAVAKAIVSHRAAGGGEAALDAKAFEFIFAAADEVAGKTKDAEGADGTTPADGMTEDEADTRLGEQVMQSLSALVDRLGAIEDKMDTLIKMSQEDEAEEAGDGKSAAGAGDGGSKQLDALAKTLDNLSERVTALGVTGCGAA